MVRASHMRTVIESSPDMPAVLVRYRHLLLQPL
jgi:hypothetical protein